MLNQKPTIPTTFREMEREREERDANFRAEPTFFCLGHTPAVDSSFVDLRGALTTYT